MHSKHRSTENSISRGADSPASSCPSAKYGTLLLF